MSGTGGASERGRALLRTVGAGNLALALLLAVPGYWLVTGAADDGGLAAVLLVQLAVWSLLLVRTAPAAAALVLAAAVLATQVLTGPLVTCGVVLPVLAAMAFQLGARPTAGRTAVVATAGLVGAATVELALDPVLVGDLGAVAVVLALAGGFGGAGLVVRSRRRLLAVLQERTDQLARQRDRTAELAVRADRARVGADLEVAISSRIEVIVAAAEHGRRAVAAGAREESRAALREVEQQGRETLAEMRAVVGALNEAPTAPTPGLGDLQRLLEHAGTDARLRVDGPARALGPHLELAAFRIVEQLVTTLGERPDDRVEVLVRFAPATLHVEVSGPRRPRLDEERRAQVAAATSAARARAQVLGGQVAVARAGDRHRVEVVLPVPVPLAG